MTTPWCLPGPPNWTPSVAVWDGGPPVGQTPFQPPPLCVPARAGGVVEHRHRWVWTPRRGAPRNWVRYQPWRLEPSCSDWDAHGPRHQVA